MTELIRNARIDSRLDSYMDFFDKKWFEDISGMAKKTKLDEAVFDLARAWLGASHVHAMPWVFATSIDGLLRQKLRECEPLSITQLRGLRERIVGMLKAKGITVRPTMAKALTEIFKELGVDADQALETANAVVGDSLHVWEKYLERNEFKTILWSGERLCYAAVYYNYECFLTECLRIKRAEPEYCLAQDKQFKKDFNESFTTALQQRCWSDQDVVIARLARHALVHNGGRMTPKLAKQPYKFLVEEGELQIMPPDVVALYALLKVRAMALVEQAVEMPDLRA
jgi:hypothetical protein